MKTLDAAAAKLAPIETTSPIKPATPERPSPNKTQPTVSSGRTAPTPPRNRDRKPEPASRDDIVRKMKHALRTKLLEDGIDLGVSAQDPEARLYGRDAIPTPKGPVTPPHSLSGNPSPRSSAGAEFTSPG